LLLATCFHCGLPIPEDEAPPLLEVNGGERAFCCHGCQAVCKAIIDAGLVDYYRHRTDAAVTANRNTVPEFLSRIELYDRPDIQKGFVERQRDWCEAALLLENIRCAACLWLNEKHLRSLDGVIDVHIDDVTQRARVRWDPKIIQLSQILTAIADIGYIAHPYDASRGRQLHQLRRRRSLEKLIFAGALGMLVMNFSLATYLMGEVDAGGQLPLWIVIGRWTSLMLATIILAYSGQEFFAGAWGDLRNRRLGMDIPVVLGLTGAYAGSLYTTITGQGEVYYDSIAMFVFFLLLARRYELGGKLLATDHIERLARLVPRSAQRLAAGDGERWDEVAVDELVPGDLLRLVPGETLAVDGVIESGISSFDESLLTGESDPVLKHPGDAVVAGSVNGDQAVIVRVTRTVQASALREMHHLVERGLEQRPRYALLAERVATGFVAVVLVVALVTAWYWLRTEPANWLPSTIAVLIVTCPCALALATPVALTVSAGELVRRGVMPLRMQALDLLATADTFAFDKTGTLTAGRPQLVEAYPLAEPDESQSIRIAIAMSAGSEHPLARALRRTDTLPPVAVTEVRNVPGAGISARLDGREWWLGKPEQLDSTGLLDTSLRERIEIARAAGRTVSVLSDGTAIQALFVFEDPLRTGVVAMLRGLTANHVREQAILSGDAPASVARIAEQLGIDEYHGGLSAADKMAWIATRQASGGRVAMFGDGINDAPALAAADVSVSFSDATDMANVSSDFLILGEDARVLVEARELAIRTRRNIMQNFSWAAGYNLIAIPFAAAGMIPPWGAAIGMSLSSLIVVTNALRLRADGREWGQHREHEEHVSGTGRSA